MKVSDRSVEKAFTVTVLFLSTSALQSKLLDLSSVQTITDGSPLMKAIWACVYLVVAVYAVRHRREIAAIIRANRLLFLLVALAIISTAWSPAPAVTIRRSIALGFTTLFGVYFCSRYEIREQLKLLGSVLAATIILSVFAELFVPSMFPPVDPLSLGGWNGVFLQKNDFGRVLALLAVVMTVRTRRSTKTTIFYAAVLLALLVIIAKTESRTALLITIVMVLAVVASSGIRWKRRTLVTLGPACALLILLLACAAISFRAELAGLMGRDMRLTGRTEIWNLSLSAIAERPLLGYGYSAFWSGSEEGARVRQLVGWDVPNAHNGYIETALDLGIVGFLICFVAYGVAIRRAVAYVQNNSGNEAKWPLTYMLFTLLYCTTESAFLASNSIVWILFSAATCTVSLPLVKESRGGVDVQQTVDSGPPYLPSEV
jgi:exopolysaccharide production protein ExoQ